MSHDVVDKFSTHLKNVLTRALCFVVETEQKTVQPEHLLWALGTQKGCIGSEILKKASVTPEQLRALIGKASPANAEIPDASTYALNLSDPAKRILEKAVLTANVYGHKYVGTEHLLSGMMQIDDNGIESFLLRHGVDVKELRGQIAIVLKSTTRFDDLTENMPTAEMHVPSPKDSTGTLLPEKSHPDPQKIPALEYFGRELTALNIQLTIDPVIGRDNEIQRLMEILCRRTKNNPLLIGDPGVGKTAIVEGFAKRIVQGDVPPPLRGKRIFALDLPLIIAGTMYRGEFESRLRQIIDEVRARPEIFLFIDEIHTLVGAGAATGSLDAANILKPALARGEVRCIGATTLEEFKKHIEPDSALERRFQTVMVDEPSPERAREILQGVAPYYESFHGVRISPSAIESAVSLSSRYIQNKQLPDKAIDLLDEAAASARILASQPGPQDQKHLLEHRMHELRDQKRRAVVEERYLDAITFKDEEQELRSALKGISAQTEMEPAHTITHQDVSRVISRMMNIPLETLLNESDQELAELEESIGARVIGQAEAVTSVASAIKRAKMGLAHPSRPLTSMLFLGPSGVGKTELAKALTEVVFKDPAALIRLDMSEYSEGFTMSKLIGAPAGYVGYREHAKLTDKVKQRPYSVVLFDEIEKAHEDVQNLLLQILEEGEIADATGRKINFRNTVIVLTSNVGLERFQRGGIGFAGSEKESDASVHADIKKELSERFRPELLNRIDHTCIFNILTEDTLARIAVKQLQALCQRIESRGIKLSVGEGVGEYLAGRVDKSYGARDMRRLIQTQVEDVIAEKLMKRGSVGKLEIKVQRGKLTLSPQKKT